MDYKVEGNVVWLSRRANNIKGNATTALDLVREDYDDREYEAIETNVDDGHLKHDVTLYYCVYLRKSDNTYWQVFYECSYNEGLDVSSVTATQVEKKEVVTIEWVSVK